MFCNIKIIIAEREIITNLRSKQQENVHILKCSSFLLSQKLFKHF